MPRRSGSATLPTPASPAPFLHSSYHHHFKYPLRHEVPRPDYPCQPASQQGSCKKGCWGLVPNNLTAPTAVDPVQMTVPPCPEPPPAPASGGKGHSPGGLSGGWEAQQAFWEGKSSGKGGVDGNVNP